MAQTPRSRLTKTKLALAEGIRSNRKRIFEWHTEHTRIAPPPFYCSIDIRDSGHKIVPVDSNLYPAGFNNICPEDQRTSPSIFRAQFDAIGPSLGVGKINRVLVLPESHTSNTYYFENLYYLMQTLQGAGVEAHLGWYGPVPESAGANGPVVLRSESGKELQAFPIRIEGGLLSTSQVTPDLVILNNDFSGGYPKDLDAVKQPILPSHKLGWHTRKKSDHFKYYNQLAGEFASIIQIDPWLIQIDTEEVSPVNFSEDEGLASVADAVDRVINRTLAAYKTHQIDQKPFVFVKNNAGTYGMGIMVVHSADEVRQMNRRSKNKMSMGKNRSMIESVAVQEGIPTATLVDRLAAEPVIYLAGGELIGGFLRTNTERGAEDNLNSQGMVFRKLCMSDLREFDEEELLIENSPSSDLGPQTPRENQDSKSEPLLELVYGSVARISALAAGKELAATRAQG